MPGAISLNRLVDIRHGCSQNNVVSGIANKIDFFFFYFSGLEDGTVVIWHVTENRFRILNGGHSDAVTRVSFSPDGQYLASLDNEEKLIIWSTKVLCDTVLYHVDKLTEFYFFNDNRIGSSFSNTSKR